MKIIAKADCKHGFGQDYQGDYMCIVKHTELEKLTGKYYGNLPKLEVGSILDLGAGYDFRDQIVMACQRVTGAKEDFAKVQSALFDFARMVADRFGKADEQTEEE